MPALKYLDHVRACRGKRDPSGRVRTAGEGSHGKASICKECACDRSSLLPW